MQNSKQGRGSVGVDEAAGVFFFPGSFDLSICTPCDPPSLGVPLWFHSRNYSQPECPPQFFIELRYFERVEGIKHQPAVEFWGQIWFALYIWALIYTLDH